MTTEGSSVHRTGTRVRLVHDPAVRGTIDVDDPDGGLADVLWDISGCVGSVNRRWVEVIPEGEDVPTKRTPRPCPFCGTDPMFARVMDMEDDFAHCYTISCSGCGIEMTDEYENTVLDQWNTRTTD